MAGTPKAFQGDADGVGIAGFQNDAFQTGAAGGDSGRLLTLLGVGFEFLIVVGGAFGSWLSHIHLSR